MSRSEAPSSPRWAVPGLRVGAAVGAVFAGLSSYVHHRLTTSGGGYTSFCNFGGSFNCDDVVTSEWGSFYGIPLSLWALGFYGVVLFVSRNANTENRKLRSRTRADLLALAVVGAGVSLFMAAVSAFVLGAFCALCVGLYAASALTLVGAAAAQPLPESLTHLSGRWNRLRRRPALAGTIAVAVVAALVLPSLINGSVRMSREEVFRADPGFYDFYTTRPIVDVEFEGGHASGPEDAPVTLVEFSDFECPHCKKAHVTLKDVLPRYGDDVRFEFFHFPLHRDCNDAVPGAGGHRHACRAAIASECAARQDRFGPYVNQLFANQDSLGLKRLREYADRVGMNLDAFDACLDDPAAAEAISRHVEMARTAGVRSTPTFFLNGRKLEGNLPYENWLYALSIELDRPDTSAGGSR